MARGQRGIGGEQNGKEGKVKAWEMVWGVCQYCDVVKLHTNITISYHDTKEYRLLDLYSWFYHRCEGIPCYATV